MQLTVQVIPKASRTELVSWDGQILKIRLNAVPEKGKANKELISFLSKTFKVSKSSIELIRGETSKLKTFEIGISQENFTKVIEAQLP